MNTNMNENELRELAYNIWEAEGRPVGQAERHWHMAVSLAESDGEQYLTGQSFAGDSFLGDSINSDDQAAILPDDREYAGNQSPFNNGSGRQQSVSSGQQQPSQSSAATDSDNGKNRRKSSKNKSSGNILV